MQNVGVIIPAYEPMESVVQVVKGLTEAGFKHVIVVDDGSSSETAGIFKQIEVETDAILITHETNQGKGAALKTGFRYAQTHLADEIIGVVTVDADGQHILKDIIAVAKKLAECPRDLILGERDFGEKVPWRSKFGNALTRKLFGWMYKQKIKDTQTGLRGIPFGLILNLLEIPYNGYEFELDCLKVVIDQNIKIQSVDIETVYIDENASSHFNPVIDSIRIYYVFFRYLIVAILSFLIDLAVFIAVNKFTNVIILSLLCARVVSGTFNFYQNKYNVYKARNKETIRKEVINYIFLAVTIFCGSYFLIFVFHQLFGLGVIWSKVIGDIILFTLSFIIQKVWIFKNRVAL